MRKTTVDYRVTKAKLVYHYKTGALTNHYTRGTEVSTLHPGEIIVRVKNMAGYKIFFF
jgi:hypothetical protein